MHRRWDVEVGLTDGLPPRFAALLDTAHVTTFDASAFGISAPEAAMMDPQQRLLMQLSWQALAAPTAAAAPTGAAAGGAAPGGGRVGVFVGISTPDYADLKKAHAPIGVYSATGKPWLGLVSQATADIVSMCRLYNFASTPTLTCPLVLCTCPQVRR